MTIIRIILLENKLATCLLYALGCPTDCEFSETCQWNDMFTAGNYLPNNLLGTWDMIAHLTPSGLSVFSQYRAKYLYVHDHHMEYVYTGRRK